MDGDDSAYAPLTYFHAEDLLARIPRTLMLYKVAQLLGIEVIRVGADVYEDRLSPLMDDHIGSSSER